MPNTSLQDCINICQAEDAIRMQVQECRPESVNSIQSAQTMVPVQRLQHSSKQSSDFNKHKNKSTQNCYYYGAPNWTREHSKVCKAKNSIHGKCGKKGHLDSLCRSSGTPVHMLEAHDYSHPQSQESSPDYNKGPETAQYSTPYFISREELPQAKCNSLKTVQVSRLGSSKQSEHI